MQIQRIRLIQQHRLNSMCHRTQNYSIFKSLSVARRHQLLNVDIFTGVLGNRMVSVKKTERDARQRHPKRIPVTQYRGQIPVYQII